MEACKKQDCGSFTKDIMKMAENSVLSRILSTGEMRLPQIPEGRKGFREPPRPSIKHEAKYKQMKKSFYFLSDLALTCGLCKKKI